MQSLGQDNFDLLTNPLFPVAFLDEKWFYTTSRRRTMKVLPMVAGFEDEMQIPTYNRPKIRSRRYPVKVMYLGVVACPLDEHDFDGRIFLKRVSRRRKVTRASRNSRFSIHVEANEQLLKGGGVHL